MNDLKKLYQLSYNLKVLYVEDDLLLQTTTHEMLSNIFKNVDLASNGQEALTKYEELFQSTGTYYDIIVTDIIMPIMDGLEFSKRVLNINKQQVIVVTSANDDSKYLVEFINIEIKRFIRKPFNLKDIIHTFFNILDSSSNFTSRIFINEEYYWDKVSKNLFINQKLLKLSYNEKLILETMLNNPSQIFSNDVLFYIIYSSSLSNEITQDAVKSAIKRLRKKLPENLIKNVYGQGYSITLS